MKYSPETLRNSNYVGIARYEVRLYKVILGTSYWNNFTDQIHDSHFLVFLMQILLAIELPNNGELGEKGEFMERRKVFRLERWLI